MSENVSENETEKTYEKHLIFSAGDRRYALPSRIISEVAALEKVFPLPLLPGYVRGIINRYSIPYALIDLNFLLLNISSGSGKIIVLKEEVDKIALLIDDVIDIADLSPEDLMKTAQEESSTTDLIHAFFEWKDSPVFCLDTSELLNRIKRDYEQN
ncbi:MAG: chemotaxis protein CheW [Treponema sp.]|nr:chemotaxis protein CheW [Treponema sp.]